MNVSNDVYDYYYYMWESVHYKILSELWDFTFPPFLFHLFFLSALSAEREETDWRNVSSCADPCNLCTKVILLRSRERWKTANLIQNMYNNVENIGNTTSISNLQLVQHVYHLNFSFWTCVNGTAYFYMYNYYIIVITITFYTLLYNFWNL